MSDWTEVVYDDPTCREAKMVVIERDEQWRQAWLVTPAPERAREILLAMLASEGGEV